MTLNASQAVDNWYAAIKAADSDALRAAVTPDILVDYPAPDGLLPWAGQWRGVNEVQSFFKVVGEYLQVGAVEIEESFETDCAFITVLRGQWTVRSTGKQVQARVVNIFKILDGLIARYQVHNDTAAFAAALERQ